MNPFKGLAKLGILCLAPFFVACSPQLKVQQYSYLLKHTSPKKEVPAPKSAIASTDLVASNHMEPQSQTTRVYYDEPAPIGKTDVKAPIVVKEETEAPKVDVSPKIPIAPKVIHKDLKQILNTADTFIGTPYLYAGDTEKGIDCSGLICQSYASVGIRLPRTSHAMAESGRKVSISEIGPGDLLFFHSYKGKGINHVAMVSKVEDGEIEFIHSTVSNGVRKDILSDPYWNQRFRMAIEIVPAGKK
ncbi:MAG: C40 family peptidase [Bacteroidia bacterium]|nr:C40 family peptidase [Bacteroidia bacterium]